MDNFDLFDAAGEVFDSYEKINNSLEKKREIEQLIITHHIANEDVDEFIAAYLNEKHPERIPLGLGEKAGRSTSEIIHESERRYNIREAQRTASKDGADILKPDYVGRRLKGSLLDYQKKAPKWGL